MTKDEFKILAKGLKAVYTYPSFLPDADSLEIWFQLLKDLDYKVCNVAIQKYMMTETRIPTPADIRNLCASVTEGETKDWGDGWEEVLMAIRQFGSYREKEAMESMSEITRKCVERLGFRNICMSENISADRSNFRQIYQALEERKKTDNRLSIGLKQQINTLLEQKERGLLNG